MQNDDNVFIGVVAEQYFSVAAAAVRRHDPEGLVFGQRFLGNDTPDAVMAAAGRHFDVISVQPAPFSFEDDNEAEASAAELARVSRAAGGRPVFVADQATHFMVPSTPLRAPCFVDENGRVHGCAANATAAGELYAQYLAELRQRPELIGYSHCQYINRAVCPGSADSQRAVECRGWVVPYHHSIYSIFCLGPFLTGVSIAQCQPLESSSEARLAEFRRYTAARVRALGGRGKP